MHGDFFNTLFALILAIVLVAVMWGLATYFTEMGSEEGKKEGKSLILGSVTTLLVLIVVFAAVEWIRAYVGI